MVTRREFLGKVGMGAAGVAVESAAAKMALGRAAGGGTASSTAASYARIAGANERVNFAIAGLNSRGYAHLEGVQANKKAARLLYAVDVDSVILQKFATTAKKDMREDVAQEKDIRKVLEKKEVDAITIATPEHWHTPMAILALEAGKHVYLEKPSSHNPAEGEMVVASQKKYGKLVQVGTQQRSSPHTKEVVEKIRGGAIGRPYLAKAWYVNQRKSIGVGKEVPVPSTLDWELWQGPAPREAYRNNVHPYNWHWFRNWGTGESLNNGTHEVDVCRWALGVGFPERVTATGGRYQYKDDWQFYDTLTTSFVYGDQMITWEGHSCQGMLVYGRERGAAILGTQGTIVVDRDGYETYDWKGVKTGAVKTDAGDQTTADLKGMDSMTVAHFANFIAGIRTGEKLNAPIEVGNVAVTMLLLSNIAWEVNRELKLDTTNAHIVGDEEAMKHWGRAYAEGWAPKV